MNLAQGNSSFYEYDATTNWLRYGRLFCSRTFDCSRDNVSWQIIFRKQGQRCVHSCSISRHAATVDLWLTYFNKRAEFRIGLLPKLKKPIEAICSNTIFIKCRLIFWWDFLSLTISTSKNNVQTASGPFVNGTNIGHRRKAYLKARRFTLNTMYLSNHFNKHITTLFNKFHSNKTSKFLIQSLL